MELTLENLDEIHNMLIISYAGANKMFESIDFDEQVLPTPEKRKLLNLLMDKMSGYLLEVSHVDSFLQYCDLKNDPLTSAQQKNILACQKLCQDLKNSADKILRWVIQMKKQFNEAACPVSGEIELDNFDDKGCAYSVQNEMEVSSSMLQTYQQFRDIFKEIHKDLLFTDPETMINTAGRRLEVMNGKQMFIETEQEMNVLIDYGLFQYRQEEKNIVQRYYNSHHDLYSGQKLNALRVLKDARFSLLRIIKPVDQHGLLVEDRLTDETLLMIDKGLHQLATSRKNYAILTHYLRATGFVMTTGASTPVSLNDVTGKKMWGIFERLIRHHHNDDFLDHKSYFQCITDLFKTAIHENVVKKVASRELPISYHQMYDRDNKH